jgi:hydrogenase/urease accessory protein HupE
MLAQLILVLLSLVSANTAIAHEVRPAYLELREASPGEFQVLWKTPMRGKMRLGLSPEFSGETKIITPVATNQNGAAAIQTWRMKAIEALGGQTVRIKGLRGTMTDALVRVEYADGHTWVKRLTYSEPAARIPVEPDGWNVAAEYLALGVDHILFGVDHLLFVLALLLVSSGTWPLIKTVTAFTLAHSLTLGLATLGFVHVPPAPVEAVIALSIVFVAAEIIHTRQERKGITAQAPWLVAFTFGLLHGFGFAGALSEVGLPQGHIPTALLFFNLGVEAGQLLFIGGALGLMAALRHVRIHLPRWSELIPPYAIGSVAMFWVFQRLSTF